MLSITEVLNSKSSLPKETLVTVFGVLFASKEIAILCESETNTSQGILVITEGLYGALLREIPAYGGGYISFIGEATITGLIQATGLNAMPYRMHSVSNIMFKSHHGIEVEFKEKRS